MIPLDFTVLIQAITGIVNPTAMLRNKLERNEAVIRLLKRNGSGGTVLGR